MTRPGPGGSVRTGGAGRPGGSRGSAGSGSSGGAAGSGSDPGDAGSDPDLAPLPVVVELTEVPALGGLYLRGVGGTARARATRRRAVAATDLPGTALVVRGVRPDAAHLTAYQHLLGETASDALPAGFVHVLAFPVATALMVRADFPLPLLGMVHVANRVEQRRAIRLGETVDIRVRAADLRSHRSGVTVDLVAEVSVADEIAWRGTSTYLAKGYHLTPPTPRPSGPAEPRPSGDAPRSDDSGGEREVWVAPEPTGLWRLDAGVGRRYAAVSGDRNPIHTSALAAKAFGFPRAIAHGMYTAARALADVGAARGESYVWQVEFAKPVLLPSTVTVRIAADDAAGAGPAGGFTFAAWDARTGRRHLRGSVAPPA
ncbi:MaoC/PaaZ C-terminal domain-containing protein [Cellulomonas sp. KRMCY2]|uniref:MaoC family dehydratase n=1 Tax=Cellulomonas sp. KRMCY2 TaxID=1304865 RepID=UPI0009E05D39